MYSFGLQPQASERVLYYIIEGKVRQIREKEDVIRGIVDKKGYVEWEKSKKTINLTKRKCLWQRNVNRENGPKY